MLEREVLKDVIRKLENLKCSGDILWYRRNQNGLFYTRNGTPINMGNKPMLEDGKDLDIVVTVNCGDGRISQLFIDTKATGKKEFDYEQQIFVESMKGKPMTMCAIVDDVKQIWPLVKKAKNL